MPYDGRKHLIFCLRGKSFYLFFYFISPNLLSTRSAGKKYEIQHKEQLSSDCILHKFKSNYCFFLFFHWLLLFSILNRGIQAICKQNLVIAVTQTSNPLVRSEAMLVIYDVLILSINLYKGYSVQFKWSIK